MNNINRVIYDMSYDQYNNVICHVIISLTSALFAVVIGGFVTHSELDDVFLVLQTFKKRNDLRSTCALNGRLAGVGGEVGQESVCMR